MNTILICRDCDTVYRAIPLRRGDVALCRRCDAVLARYFGAKVESGLALVCAAAIFFAIANLTPILSIDIAGTETKANIWFAVRSLQQGWISVAALGLAFTTFLIPAVQIALLFWVLLFARIEHRAPLSSEMPLALLIAGIVFYIPANLLPVMHTSGLLGEADSTILGGIFEFWRAGDWDIALLIFIASVAVPFTKFIAIGLLLLTVRKNSRGQQHQRTVLYRVVGILRYLSVPDG